MKSIGEKKKTRMVFVRPSCYPCNKWMNEFSLSKALQCTRLVAWYSQKIFRFLSLSLYRKYLVSVNKKDELQFGVWFKKGFKNILTSFWSAQNGQITLEAWPKNKIDVNILWEPQGTLSDSFFSKWWWWVCYVTSLCLQLMMSFFLHFFSSGNS